MNSRPHINPAQNAAPPRDNAPRLVPSFAARLLNVIRTLIDIGQQRLAAIQAQQLSPQDEADTGHAFGTFNLSVIVARIIRGLRLATALEQRVVAAAARRDSPKPAAKPRAPRRASAPRKPRLSDTDDNAALLARMPTEQEIAAMVRHRPIGLLLNDICADLGIGPGQPQWQAVWRALRDVVAPRRGQETCHFDRAFQRAAAAYQEVVAGIAPNWKFHSIPEWMRKTTGPPSAQPAT